MTSLARKPSAQVAGGKKRMNKCRSEEEAVNDETTKRVGRKRKEKCIDKNVENDDTDNDSGMEGSKFHQVKCSRKEEDEQTVASGSSSGQDDSSDEEDDDSEEEDNNESNNEEEQEEEKNDKVSQFAVVLVLTFLDLQ